LQLANKGRGHFGAGKEVLRVLLPMLRMQRATKSKAEICRVRHEAVMQKMLRQVPLRIEKTHQEAFKKVKKTTDKS